MGKLNASLASEMLTATWQLSCLPSCPQYCRATPTEWRPCFGKPVSSISSASGDPARRTTLSST